MGKHKDGFYRGPDGKISNKAMSPYGKRQLAMLDGAKMHYPDGTLVVRKNKLILEETGEVVDTINSDRKVNKIIFRVM